jgi:hypothetical protein
MESKKSLLKYGYTDHGNAFNRHWGELDIQERIDAGESRNDDPASRYAVA